MARTGGEIRRGRAKSTASEAEPVSDAAESANETEVAATEAHSAKAQEDLANTARPSISGEPSDQSEVEPAAKTVTVASDAPPALSVGRDTDALKSDVPESARSPEVAAPVALGAAPSRRGSAIGLILGGVVAAAIGAGATLYLLPHGWQPADTLALEARLSTLETRDTQTGLSQQDLDSAIATLAARIDALDTATVPPDLAVIEARLAALETSGTLDQGQLTEAMAPMHERLDRIEGSIAARIEAAVLQALATAQTRQNEQVQALEVAQHDLEAAQTRLEARAALSELIAAAETGRAAEAALVTLAAATDLPPALDAFRGGLPTLGALQESYPAAARAALAAAPGTEESSTTDRLIGFLRSQTGARSLAPRDGDDTDAILSRAEARLRAADLPGAVNEIDTLPDEPAAAMAAWRAQAGARLTALEALADVQARLGSD